MLEPHRDRITWDAPIHSWADVEALPFAPQVPEREAVALRHARSGCSSSTSAARQEGIELYGGGQFELSVGRGQIQILAALFSADGPNDVAPGGYNANEPIAGPRDEPAQAAARALRLPARRPG